MDLTELFSTSQLHSLGPFQAHAGTLDTLGLSQRLLYTHNAISVVPVGRDKACQQLFCASVSCQSGMANTTAILRSRTPETH
jgi:hypothetical protein